MNTDLIEYLSDFVTPERLQLFNNVIENRTRYLTVALEDIFQPQNASAVLRTCDCFGIQNVHIIENRNKFSVDREVAMGASKWLNLHKYNENEQNSLVAIHELKKQGYRIVATTPHEGDTKLEEFDLSKGKAAIVFGTELTGITDIIKEEADEFVKIPMYGFTESFNISVSAAITMHHLTHQLRFHSGIEWMLSEKEKQEVKLEWLRRTIKSSKLLEKRFIKNRETK
ncbi:TrmH family RNA methyltransferase [Sunxiuqinia sp. A32]|uniref:TrmH family RNA methyltransferase n=1 Tax=Sunxiuqinia sp. A32 TaxID=3461496 RepID=UPI004045B8FA